MNFLFDNIDTIINAPNGIKKLRELILRLAVQGKLVPQNPADEPASILLEKIKAEKQKLIKEGTIRKQDPLPPIKDSEKPFDLPHGWEWTRLYNLGETQTGTTPSKNNSNNFGNFIPFIGPGDINQFQINYANNGLSEIGIREGRLIKAHSILMVCIGGSIGKSAINVVDVACNQQINTITPYVTDMLKYILYSFISPYFQNSLVQFSSGSATPIINKQKWSSILIPIPPLSEQKRIVAKVDSLMALCDELENQKQHRRSKSLSLGKAAINALLTAQDRRQFDNCWNLITENFDRIFDTADNVKELKAAILQLAVQGKLTPQNPTDEPASILLEKIKAEKQKLIKEGKIRKQDPLPPIKDSEKPFELPGGWVWARLGNETTYSLGLKIEPAQIDDDTWVLELEDIEKETSKLLKKERFSTRSSRSTKNRFYKGDVIYGKLRPYLDKVIIADEDGVCTTEMIPLNGYGHIHSGYLRLYLKSPKFIEYANNSTHGMNLPRLGTDKAKMAMLALPPLAEQKRIVAKVDSLMSLCSELETRLTAKEEKSEKLVAAFISGQ